MIRPAGSGTFVFNCRERVLAIDSRQTPTSPGGSRIEPTSCCAPATRASSGCRLPPRCGDRPRTSRTQPVTAHPVQRSGASVRGSGHTSSVVDAGRVEPAFGSLVLSRSGAMARGLQPVPQTIGGYGRRSSSKEERIGAAVAARAEGAEEAKSAGRIGARRGKVSELTMIAPLRPGGAKRMRAFFDTLHGSIGRRRTGATI